MKYIVYIADYQIRQIDRTMNRKTSMWNINDKT